HSPPPPQAHAAAYSSPARPFWTRARERAWGGDLAAPRPARRPPLRPPSSRARLRAQEALLRRSDATAYTALHRPVGRHAARRAGAASARDGLRRTGARLLGRPP